jgi:hypothetical protein
MKTIHRRKIKTDFTTLPNALLRECSLSYTARGILSMMLSHSEEWRSSMKEIEKHGTEGRKSIRRAIHELESAGYAVRQTIISPSGVFSGVLWTWHDSPVQVSRRSNPRKYQQKNRPPSDPLVPDAKGSELRKNNSEQHMEKTPKRKLVTTGTNSIGGLTIGYIPSTHHHD